MADFLGRFVGGRLAVGTWAGGSSSSDEIYSEEEESSAFFVSSGFFPSVATPETTCAKTTPFEGIPVEGDLPSGGNSSSEAVAFMTKSSAVSWEDFELWARGGVVLLWAAGTPPWYGTTRQNRTESLFAIRLRRLLILPVFSSNILSYDGVKMGTWGEKRWGFRPTLCKGCTKNSCPRCCGVGSHLSNCAGSGKGVIRSGLKFRGWCWTSRTNGNGWAFRPTLQRLFVHHVHGAVEITSELRGEWIFVLFRQLRPQSLGSVVTYQQPPFPHLPKSPQKIKIVGSTSKFGGKKSYLHTRSSAHHPVPKIPIPFVVHVAIDPVPLESGDSFSIGKHVMLWIIIIVQYGSYCNDTATAYDNDTTTSCSPPIVHELGSCARRQERMMKIFRNVLRKCPPDCVLLFPRSTTKWIWINYCSKMFISQSSQSPTTHIAAFREPNEKNYLFPAESRKTRINFGQLRFFHL